MATFEQEQVVNRLSIDGEFSTITPTEQDLTNPDFRIKIKSLLFAGEVLIEFTKTNGESRVMKCTTSERFGAQYTTVAHLDESVSPGKVRKTNDEVCSVWDTKIGAWRSFRWANLKKVDYVNNI